MKNKTIETVRTNETIEENLYEVWEEGFSDIPRKNLVLILFGRYSKRRLGSIKWATKNSRIKFLLKEKEGLHMIQDDSRISIITLTRYFAHKEVPDNIVKMTIAHELVHYAHGFHSPLPKLYTHPHRGNVVNKELVKRGMGNELTSAEEWLESDWHQVVKNLNKQKKK